MKKISVIVPVLNSKEHLNRIIIGLLKQTYTNLEIIIVDTGSSDGTFELSQEWSFLDKRIKCCKTYEPVFDYGVRVSNGEYILFVDNINLDDNTMLESMVKALINDNSDISVYNSNYNKVTNYLVCNEINIINNLDGVLWNKLFKKSLFLNYKSIDNLFKVALKKAVRISLFV